jgi:hypothetical protein
MSGVSFPVSRPGGRALVVGSASNRPQIVALLQQLGLSCAEVDDPYAAAAELARRPLVYRALILSLASVFREELAIISSVKRRLPHLDVWLTHTDGRPAALADAMRLGADGLLSEEGLHRTSAGAGATPDETLAPNHSETPLPHQHVEEHHNDLAESDPFGQSGEPVLTADELRALLQEQTNPPGEEGSS